MGLFDLFKGGGSSKNKCAYCKKETDKLPVSKKVQGEIQYFCSKECSRKYRIEKKKQAKKPPTSTGPGLPW